MGFPDNYTDLPGAKKTNRYQAIGNSWAVPVVRWIGERLVNAQHETASIIDDGDGSCYFIKWKTDEGCFFDFGKDIANIGFGVRINCTATPEESVFGNMMDIVSPEAPEDIYISPTGCFGIVRRSRERNLSINERLKEVLLSISSEWSEEDIEKRSRVQKRGRFSSSVAEEKPKRTRTIDSTQLSLFDPID